MPEDKDKAVLRSETSKKALQPKGKNYLFVVGIDDYKHHNPLNNAVSDAKSLKKLLTEQYDFDAGNVVELFNADATQKSIMQKLRSYEALTPDDNLLFFYSGHGYYRGGLGYLVPVDAEDEEDFILNSSLRDRLSLIKAKHIALIFDACFSGSFVLSKDVLGERLAHKPSRWALAAGNIELVSDGIAGRNSPFTTAMLDVLTEFEDDEIGIQRLFIETRDKTILRGATQTPIGGSMKMEGNEGGEFVFHRKNLEAETWNALNKTNKSALRAFIEKYPKSTFTNEALAFIETIEAKEAAQRQADEAHRQQEAEKNAFHNAKNSSDPKAALSKFVLQYPNHVEARTLLADVQVEAAWKKAKRKGDLTDFQFFQEDYPNSKYSEECKNRIDAFKEPDPKPEPVKVVETPTPVVVVVPEVKRVEPIVEKPRPEPTKIVEKPTPVVEKPKTEPVKVEKTPIKLVDTPPQYIDPKEPTFFEKHKIPLISSAVLLAFLIWFLIPKSTPIIKPVDNSGITNTPPNTTPQDPVKPVPNPTTDNATKIDEKPKPLLNATIQPEMVSVQGGTFDMGDNFNDPEAGSDEKLVHSVTLSSYSIGKYEVTFDEFDAFCEATKRTKPKDEGWGRGKRPVINVSWDDATAYCKWLKAKTGKNYRLPTEAEWEFAARDRGKKVRFGNGKDIADPSEINFDGSAGNKVSYSVAGTYRQKTVAVNSLNANGLGLYHMSGNVWEWCSDFYGNYSSSAVSNPTGAAKGSYRVFRGGSWGSYPQFCRATYRYGSTPAYRNYYLGFRVASSL
jgi:formylglycine-generating enzyme required for sulfatase activity